jgi:hypothetical protein
MKTAPSEFRVREEQIPCEIETAQILLAERFLGSCGERRPWPSFSPDCAQIGSIRFGGRNEVEGRLLQQSERCG